MPTNTPIQKSKLPVEDARRIRNRLLLFPASLLVLKKKISQDQILPNCGLVGETRRATQRLSHPQFQINKEPPIDAVLEKELIMNLLSRFPRFWQMLGRRISLWLAVAVVTAGLNVTTAHAQRHPPTIPISNGSVTIRSNVGGPNAVRLTFGGTQSGQFQQGQPAPMTFSPAISPPPQQPARIYYVYYRNAPELPWTCFGGYRSEYNALQSVNWFRQRGGDAFYR